MSSSTNGITIRPQVWDGEAVDPADFNSMSNIQRAYMNDLVLGAAMRVAQNSVSGIASYSSPCLFAFGHGGAPRHGGSARSFSCNSGMLFYAPASGSITGTAQNILGYYVQAGEISGTFAAADPTNPRLDIVYVRVTDVDGPLTSRNFEDATGAKSTQSLVIDKRSKLEWIIVTGTPSSKPQIPAAPDGTWAAWGLWHVPATFNTTFSGPSKLWDWRIPCDSFKRHFVPGPVAAAGDSNWTRNSGETSVHNASSSSASLDVVCPARSGRIMAAGMTFGNSATGTATIQTRIYNPSLTLCPPAGNFGEPSNGMTGYAGYTLNRGLWINTSRVQVSSSTDGYALLPLWANGYGCESEDVSQGGGDIQAGQSTYDIRNVSMRWTASSLNGFIVGFTFDVAG